MTNEEIIAAMPAAKRKLALVAESHNIPDDLTVKWLQLYPNHTTLLMINNYVGAKQAEHDRLMIEKYAAVLEESRNSALETNRILTQAINDRAKLLELIHENKTENDDINEENTGE